MRRSPPTKSHRRFLRQFEQVAHLTLTSTSYWFYCLCKRVGSSPSQSINGLESLPDLVNLRGLRVPYAYSHVQSP